MHVGVHYKIKYQIPDNSDYQYSEGKNIFFKTLHCIFSFT